MEIPSLRVHVTMGPSRPDEVSNQMKYELEMKQMAKYT